MSTNRISKVKDFVDHNAVKDNIANITNNDIRQTEFLFDYALLDIENTEKEKLKKYEKNLLFHKKQINKATADMGRAFIEAREVFITSHSESFVEWYEKLGFNKDQVSVAMNRYRMTIEYPNAKDVIINLSDVVIKEVSNKKTPSYIKEKVISGEIVTGQQIKEERKNSSKALEKFSEEKKEIIQEAELVVEEAVEEKVSLDKINVQLEVLMNEFSRVEKAIKENNTESNFEMLLRIQGLLNQIK